MHADMIFVFMERRIPILSSFTIGTPANPCNGFCRSMKVEISIFYHIFFYICTYYIAKNLVDSQNFQKYCLKADKITFRMSIYISVGQPAALEALFCGPSAFSRNCPFREKSTKSLKFSKNLALHESIF
jgi:hypothetical protein